jgi:hypothetical protein
MDTTEYLGEFGRRYKLHCRTVLLERGNGLLAVFADRSYNVLAYYVAHCTPKWDISPHEFASMQTLPRIPKCYIIVCGFVDVHRTIDTRRASHETQAVVFHRRLACIYTSRVIDYVSHCAQLPRQTKNTTRDRTEKIQFTNGVRISRSRFV